VPYFEGLERTLGLESAAEHDPNPTSEAFLRACAELGFDSTDDFNGEQMLGAGWHHLNIKDGKRWSAKTAYFDAAATRENLRVAYDAVATRLLFDGDRCTGVEWVARGAVKRAGADREVILCAGAMESPKLLMLSGIGPASELGRHGIDVLVDLPGVGANFHNHVLTGVVRECVKPVPPGRQNLSEAALFCTSEPGWPVPDLQIAFVHVPFDPGIGEEHPNSVSILPGVVRPLSRGSIRLASADPLAPPLVDPSYLAARSDLERLARAVELSRQVFATVAFAEWLGGELMPGPEVRTHEQVLDFCRGSAASYHHQAGSCKMGLDELAVVDPQLRVFGTEGLRVADASVMPAVPSGNCNAGIVMIAERCADLVVAARDGELPAVAVA
jgi:choline dehydrogenase